MNYVFVLDEQGVRQTSYVVGVHADTLEETEQLAKQYYPTSTIVIGDSDMQSQFLSGKIFKDGNMIDKPPVVKSNEQILREKRAEIEQEYLPRLDAIKGGITARLAQGQDITELQNQYKTMLAEMTKKLNSVTVS